MKKKLLAGFATGVLVLGLAESISAAPIYYTFSGEVTTINTGGGVVDNFGIQIGQSVTYVFEVDHDAPGFEITIGGQLTWYLDTPNNDFYYTDLVSDGYLDEINGGSNNGLNDKEEFHEAFDMLNLGGGTHLGCGSDDHFVYLQGSVGFGGSFIYDWTIGQYVVGHEIAYNNINQAGSFRSELCLTGISSINPLDPVPEPATMLLFGIGLAGVAGTRLIRKK